MNITTDEKFISIEYETWKKKYLPLEEKLKELEKELKKEKESKTITLRLGIYRHSIYSHGAYNEIALGYIEPVSLNNSKLYQFEIIQDAVKQVVYNMRSYTPVFLSEENAKELYEKLGRSINELEIKKVEVERIRFETRELLSGIPKFIKWLFKIKG